MTPLGCTRTQRTSSFHVTSPPSSSISLSQAPGTRTRTATHSSNGYSENVALSSSNYLISICVEPGVERKDKLLWLVDHLDSLVDTYGPNKENGEEGESKEIGVDRYELDESTRSHLWYSIRWHSLLCIPEAYKNKTAKFYELELIGPNLHVGNVKYEQLFACQCPNILS